MQVNRSGMPGGQTLGPIAVSYLPMQGADIGIPMLAMHSARRTGRYERLSGIGNVFENIFCIKKLQKKLNFLEKYHKMSLTIGKIQYKISSIAVMHRKCIDWRKYMALGKNKKIINPGSVNQ